MMAPSFTFDRLFKNKSMIYSILFEVGLICLLVYTPSLDEFFQLDYTSPKHASVGLWMPPFIIIFEETRKYLIRQEPNGKIAKYTLFWSKFKCK